VVSAWAAGAFGLTWAIAYLVAELVGLCTWRPLRQRSAHTGQVLAAIVLTSLIEAAVYVTALSAVVTATVPGQMLGKAEALAATITLAAPIRAAWRHHRRPATPGGEDA
jgi:hypothetical protein